METAVLGQSVNSGYLASQLAKGVLPATVAEELLTSNAGKAALLTTTFSTVLDRSPSSQETSTYVGLMNQGVFLRDVQAVLLASNEFYDDVVVSLASASPSSRLFFVLILVGRLILSVSNATMRAWLVG